MPPQIQLTRVYVKSSASRQAGAPAMFTAGLGSHIGVHLHLDVAWAALTEAALFEVRLTGTLTLGHAAQPLSVFEVEQAGLFGIAGATPAQLDAVLSVPCAAALFPYLRANIADAMTRATLTPLHLPDVDFGRLFEQRVAALRAQPPESKLH